MSQGIAVTAVASGDRLHVLAFTSDGTAHHRWRDGAGWSTGWKVVSTDLAAMPTLTSWGPGRLDLIAIEATGKLVHQWTNDGGEVWLPPQDLEHIGDRFGETPAAVCWGVERLDIVGIRDGDVWHKSSDRGVWWPDGQQWTSLGGDPVGVAMCTSGPRRLDVVTLADQHVWHRSTDDGVHWSNPDAEWADLGGPVGMTPVPCTARGQGLDVIAVDLDGKLRYRSPAGTWSGIDDQTAVFPPTVVSSRRGRIDVVACNVDQRIVHRWLDETGWNPDGWVVLGQNTIEAPVLVSRGSGRMDLLAITDAGVRYLSYERGWAEDWEVLGVPSTAATL